MATSVIVRSIIHLSLITHFRGNQKKVTPFLKYKLKPKVSKDIKEVYGLLGFENAKGIVLNEFGLL